MVKFLKKEIIKQVDEQGRVLIPKKWRDKCLKKCSTVILEMKDDQIVIKCHNPVDITKYFDSIDIDLKSDLDDWDEVKRELYLKRQETGRE